MSLFEPLVTPEELQYLLGCSAPEPESKTSQVSERPSPGVPASPAAALTPRRSGMLALVGAA